MSLVLKSGLGAIQITSAIAITVQVYDVLLTFNDEVRFIWTKPHTSLIKWLFLCMRYFALASVITSRVLLEYTSKHGPFSPSTCRSLYIYEVSSGHVIIACIEVIMLLRVYLLYDRSRFIQILLSFVFVTGLVVDIAINIRAMASLKFTLYCFALLPGDDIVAFSVIALYSPIIVLVLTITKYVRAIRAGWGGNRLLVLLLRDGVGVFGIVLVIWITILLLSLLNKSTPSLLGNYLFLALVPPLGCRVIINLQKVRVEDNAPQLTSVDLCPPDNETTFALGFRCREETSIP